MRYLAIVLLAVLLGGCFHYPLGMTEAQWTALSANEQRAARLEQEKRDQEFDRIRAAEELRFDDAYGLDIDF